MADPELLLDRDLHVIDMIAVPDRLEHAVREPQHQDVLDRFLPEIVVDPIDLLFAGDFQQVVVERLRRREVGAERLLDHEPPPYAVVFAQHPATTELPADRRECIGRSCEVVQAVAAGFPFRLQPVQLFVQVFKRTRNVRIGGNAGDAFQQPAGDRIVDRAGGEFV